MSTDLTPLLAKLSEIHRYWFGELKGPNDLPEGRPALWFQQSDATDEHIRGHFAETLERAASLEWNPSQLSKDQQIGLVVLFDQFPRNLFRTTGEAFAYDPQASALVNRLLARGDEIYHPLERVFLYLPLEHSESLRDQDRAVALYRRLVNELGEGQHPFYKSALDFAEKHRVLIERFGRFPHRNVMLGRESTPEELAFMEEHGRGY
jgi:uncharacterized protein (DUF924 family)